MRGNSRIGASLRRDFKVKSAAGSPRRFRKMQKVDSVQFAGSDYLGLAGEPRVANAACKAARGRGFSTGAGRWSIGWSELHQRLEDELKLFFRTEDACIQGSAYLCGPAFFAAAALRFDTVFCDENSHPNLILGMRGAGFRIEPYRHLDAEDLKRRLAGYRGRPPIIASDGLFGISGEFAPLAEIAGVAEECGAPLFVDDAHGVFSVGSSGRGSVELNSLSTETVVLMGSMSKALGVYGGFIAGSKHWIDKIRRAVNYVGSTPPPFPVVAGCLEALRIAVAEPERRSAMQQAVCRMRSILQRFSIQLVSDPRAPIVTMLLEDPETAKDLAAVLNENGLVLRYLDYPSEPRKNLLRTAARAIYTEQHFSCFTATLARFIDAQGGKSQ